MSTEAQSTELSHFDVTEAALNEIKTYNALTITGLDDKKGYEEVRVALREVVSIRNKVVKRRQDIKRQIDQGAKYILDNIAPVEAHLSRQKDAIDAEKERIKQAEAEKRQRQFVERTGALFALGFQFNGSIYSLGEMMLSVADIHERDADQWDSTIHRANEVAAQIDQAKAEAEAKAREEQEAKDREIAELRAKLAAFAPPAPTAEPAPIIANIPAINAEPAQNVTFAKESSVVSVSAPATPLVPQPANAISPQQAAIAESYKNGFEECRYQVLLIMQDQTKRTRAEFIELFKTLQP